MNRKFLSLLSQLVDAVSPFHSLSVPLFLNINFLFFFLISRYYCLDSAHSIAAYTAELTEKQLR